MDWLLNLLNNDILLNIAVLIIFILGIATGSVLFHRIGGILRIDRSNPEKDIYCIELDDLDGLSRKKYIILKIDNHADLSQK